MNFYIENILLWMNDDELRSIDFKKDKINVITGESHTGKSAILQIIDYCFFASKSQLPDSIINENVAWYGVKHVINNKTFTLVRSSLSDGAVTDQYYFSSTGNIPKVPYENNNEDSIKKIVENEFGIDRNVKIPFGGKIIKSGTKISLRYFQLFSTISEDIITNKNVFVDKQEEGRYREALHRIFDIAVGIDDVQNILKREKRNNLEYQLKFLQKKQEVISKKKTEFIDEINVILRQAKEYGIIGEYSNYQDSIIALKDFLNNYKIQQSFGTKKEFDKLKKEEYRINGVLRNLNKLRTEYDEYKSNLKNTIDSLKPVDFLLERKRDLVETSIFNDILSYLKKDLHALAQDAKKNIPVDANVTDLIYEQENLLHAVREKLASMPKEIQSFENEKNKYFFLGEVNAKLDLYTGKQKQTQHDYCDQIRKLENEVHPTKAYFVS